MNSPMLATPFELKSDHENDNDPAAVVTKAIDAFQSAVDRRFDAIETRLADEKKLIERLAKIETRLARPGASVETKSANDNGEIERKAFISYVRRGVERMPADEAKALTVATGATAGYLAPVQFGAELIKLLTQFSPIRQYAKVVQISAPEITYPRRTSALAASWVGEIATRIGSAPSFEQVTLGLLPVSWTPRLGVFMKPEVADATTEVRA